MTEATVANFSEARESLGPRFRLSGLMLLVLAAGLSPGVLSRAHVLVAAGQSFWVSPVTLWLGVVVAPIGVVLGLALAIQAIARSDCRVPLRKQAWPICSRLAAMGLLVSPRNRRPASLDRVFDSAVLGSRFLGHACALTAILLAAVATLALSRLVVLPHALAAARSTGEAGHPWRT